MTAMNGVAAVQAEAFMSLADASFSVAARLGSLQLQAARSMLTFAADSSAEIYGQALKGKIVASGAEGVGTATARMMACLREIAGISAQAQADMSELAECCISDMSRAAHGVLDKVAATAPGPQAAVTLAAMKDVVAAAGSAGKSVINHVRQVAPLLGMNVLAGETAATARKTA
jgi:hypothetical protein